MSDKNPTIAELPTALNPIKFAVGQTWLFRLWFINTGADSAFGVPDTLESYQACSATKDTTIENVSYLVIEETLYASDQYTIDTFKYRYAIHFGDSAISMYSLGSSGQSGFGLLKRKLPNTCMMPISKYGATILREINYSKLLKSTGSRGAKLKLWHSIDFYET